MTQGLIEPLRSGQALADEVRNTSFDGLGAAVWWLGQSGFLVKSCDGLVCFDPYLSERLTHKYAGTQKPHDRMTRAPLRGRDITGIDIVVSTHQHTDHMDPETVPDLLTASPNARYVLPRAHVERVKGWGVDEHRLVPADVDVPLRFGDLVLQPLPAAHEGFDLIEGVGHPYMGFVLKTGGVTFYHSGDTIPYPGMIERLRDHAVDVAFLPINGRDAPRHALGTPGNCTIEEALCIARLAGVAMVIPHHYDMFRFNTVDVGHFASWAEIAYRELRTRVLSCGERCFIDLPLA
jgi:L-ascorbate 6-phosphate lactonase